MNKYASEAREAAKKMMAERSCFRKKRYDTLGEATVCMPAGQHAYFCMICRGYHRTGRQGRLEKYLHRRRCDSGCCMRKVASKRKRRRHS